jgi:cytochrome c oxidase subunit 2
MTFAFLMESLGIAPNASLHGYDIDNMLEMLHWFMLILFVGWGGFYAYTLWRFRHGKNPRANYVGTTSHLPTKLEGGVLVLEVVLLMAFAAPIWANRVDAFPRGSGVVHLRTVGQQFLWNFEYTGPDGKFGTHKIGLVTSSNQLGIDRSDLDAKDNLVTVGEMHLPVNRPCIIDVSTKDVIHDFCIPNMRVATDAMPGAIIPIWFVPVKTGTYDIVCAQLCGSNHSLMRATLVVDTEADYKKWFDETAKLSGATVVDGAPVTPPGASSDAVATSTSP